MTDDEQYRLVLHGTGRRSGSLAAAPRTRAEAIAGERVLADTFADDIAAGDMRIELMAEAEYQRRQRGGNSSE